MIVLRLLFAFGIMALLYACEQEQERCICACHEAPNMRDTTLSLSPCDSIDVRVRNTFRHRWLWEKGEGGLVFVDSSATRGDTGGWTEQYRYAMDSGVSDTLVFNQINMVDSVVLSFRVLTLAIGRGDCAEKTGQGRSSLLLQ